MGKPLWQIIKEIEEKEGITDYYLHHNYGSGDLELNIEFNDEAQEELEKINIRTIDACAYWE